MHARPEWLVAHAMCWQCQQGCAATLSTARGTRTCRTRRELQGYSPANWQISSSTTCIAEKQHGGPALGCVVSATLEHMLWQPATLFWLKGNLSGSVDLPLQLHSSIVAPYAVRCIYDFCIIRIYTVLRLNSYMQIEIIRYFGIYGALYNMRIYGALKCQSTV